MSKITKSQSEDPEVVIESALNRTEQFIEKKGKVMLIALTAIVLCVGGYFAYQHLYKTPQAQKAATAMFNAQYQFEQEEFENALKGTSSYSGFEQIAKEYSSLPQGNLAKHYAGICNLYLGKYQEALDYFKSFSGVDGAIGTIISAQNYGLMGDAYVELNDMQNGVQMYEKAAALSDNGDTAPTYLKKAALVNEELGNYKAALEQYKTIKFSYPQNFIARDIDKYIAMVEQKL